MLRRSSSCIHPEGMAKGLERSTADKLLSFSSTCTISWSGSNRSALHCVLLPAHISGEQDYCSEAGSAGAFMGGMSMKLTAVLLLST